MSISTLLPVVSRQYKYSIFVTIFLVYLQDFELHEDKECMKVFPQFLKFMYSCHAVLNADNTLPLLILADKYNVVDLRFVCIHFSRLYIIPKLQLKEVSNKSK